MTPDSVHSTFNIRTYTCFNMFFTSQVEGYEGLVHDRYIQTVINVIADLCDYVHDPAT